MVSNKEKRAKPLPSILSGSSPPKVPPDGKWGWVIVVAYAMANMIIIPVMLSFGLVYKDQLPELGLSATDVSIIMNTFSAFGMSFGLVNGPLIRNFGYRKVGIAAGVFFSLGMFLTSWAKSFTHFMITYSLIAASGMGMATSSFSFALNSFFRKRRSRAMGLAATLTGLGPIVVPQLTSVLLEHYGTQGCVLLLSALSLHIIAAGLLLQPIKWHLVDAPAAASMAKPTAIEVEMHPITTAIKEEQEDEEEDNKEQDQSVAEQTILTVPEEIYTREHGGFSDFSSEDEEDYMDLPIRRLSIEHEIETQSIYGLDIVPVGSVLRLNSQQDHHQPIANFQSKQDLSFQRQHSHDPSAHRHLRLRRQSSTLSNRPRAPAVMRSLSHLPPPKPKRWFEVSHETINLGSSMNIFNERAPDERKVMIREPQKYSGFPAGSMKITEEANKIEEKSSQVVGPPKSAMKHNYSSVASVENRPVAPPPKNKRTASYQLRKLSKSIVDIFDLNLLRDPIYLNLMLGMSIAIFAEINFSVLTPLILNDMGYDTDQIASVMSALALTDLIFRFLAPYIGEILKQPARIMYMISLVLLIITRSFVYVVDSYTGMLIVGILLGIAKGVRTVYMNIVIPDYIPIERLASASGIQMVTNGVILMGAGPLLGWIRDVSGSYLICIVIINLVTLCAVLMWTIEMAYNKYRTNKDKT